MRETTTLPGPRTRPDQYELEACPRRGTPLHFFLLHAVSAKGRTPHRVLLVVWESWALGLALPSATGIGLLQAHCPLSHSAIATLSSSKVETSPCPPQRPLDYNSQ